MLEKRRKHNAGNELSLCRQAHNALTCRSDNAIIRRDADARRHAPGQTGPGGSVALDTYELAIQAQFAAAHRLREYDGNCERLHGHNWKVDVVLQGQVLNGLGMLLDFREAKRLIEEVLGPFDHQCLNDLEPFRDQNPTTENIARTVYEMLSARLPEGISVAKITAWESDHCGATYSRPLIAD